jgi:hypothetical protein
LSRTVLEKIVFVPEDTCNLSDFSILEITLKSFTGY